jgi:hypothetical protein
VVLTILHVTSARRFPPPWSVEETDACFIVRDANGQALAYVYFKGEPGRRSAAHLLSERPCDTRAYKRDKLAPPHHFPRAETLFCLVG